MRNSLRFITLSLAVATGACLPLAAQPFTFAFDFTNLDNYHFGALAWGDVNRDGLPDVLLTGTQEVALYVPSSRLYLNRGASTVLIGEETFPVFMFDGANLPVAVWHSDAAWSDFDRDGDIDLALLGATNGSEPYESTTQILQNNGSGSFSVRNANLPGLYSGSVDWGDYDNDGDDDLLLTGYTGDGPATHLYRNDGTTFTEVETPLPDVAFGAGRWGDYDRDGDLDLVLTGIADEGFITYIYRNDGGTFSQTDIFVPGVAFSEAAWGDYDNDGYLDLAVIGGVLDARVLAGRLYVVHNDGGSSFSPVMAENGAFIEGSVLWGDYDNDGDTDLLTLGATYPNGPRSGKLYRAEGQTLTPPVLYLPGVAFGEAAWSDFDNDSDLDLLLAGQGNSPSPFTNLYRNTQRIVNTPPTPPTGLRAEVQAGSIQLTWEAATDEQTPAPGLSYNLRVGTTPGGVNIVAPMADPATGARYVTAPGNAGPTRTRRLAGLPAGTYYWSVQAVDASYKASAFAEEGSFTISSTGNTATTLEDAPALPTGLTAVYPSPFRETATIRYALPQPAPVTITIYDIRGRVVRHLVQHLQPSGTYAVDWDGRDDGGVRVGPGLYLVRLVVAGAEVQTRPLLRVP